MTRGEFTKTVLRDGLQSLAANRMRSGWFPQDIIYRPVFRRAEPQTI